MELNTKCFYLTFVKHWSYYAIRRHEKIISDLILSVILEAHGCKFLEIIVVFSQQCVHVSIDRLLV